MGGSLEDLSYDVLPACIEKYHGIEVDELGRDFVRVDGKELEVNPVRFHTGHYTPCEKAEQYFGYHPQASPRGFLTG